MNVAVAERAFPTGRALFLVGPTGVGKTEASLWLAKRIDAEIVSADSMLVYCGMDIGTAKPTPEERAAVRHHLIDVLEPTESFSVGKYRQLAKDAIADIHGRGKMALVCGGTGLYVRALVDGLFEGPGADWPLREELEAEVERSGPQSLHAELMKVDRETAEKLSPKDVRRVIRALEVHSAAHRPISELQSQWKQRGRGPTMLGLTMKRSLLYQRIEERVDRMFERGLVEETEKLLERGLRTNRTAMQAIGYKEVVAYLSGECSLEEAKKLLKRNSRRYAKRQLTWFRKDDRIKWYNFDDYATRQELYEGLLEGLRGMTKTTQGQSLHPQ